MQLLGDQPSLVAQEGMDLVAFAAPAAPADGIKRDGYRRSARVDALPGLGAGLRLQQLRHDGAPPYGVMGGQGADSVNSASERHGDGTQGRRGRAWRGIHR